MRGETWGGYGQGTSPELLQKGQWVLVYRPEERDLYAAIAQETTRDFIGRDVDCRIMYMLHYPIQGRYRDATVKEVRPLRKNERVRLRWFGRAGKQYSELHTSYEAQFAKCLGEYRARVKSYSQYDRSLDIEFFFLFAEGKPLPPGDQLLARLDFVEKVLAILDKQERAEAARSAHERIEA